MNLFLDILSTFISYTIIPFIIFFKRKNKYDNKLKNIILILNSIFISIFFIGIRIYLNFDEPIRTFTPAFLYYFINMAIWNNTFTKKDNSQKEIKKNTPKKLNNKKRNFKKIIIYLIPLLLITMCLVYILIFNNNINNKLDTSYMEDYIFIPTRKATGIWQMVTTSKAYIIEIKNQLIINNYILKNKTKK